MENECRKEEHQVETRKFFSKSCDSQDLFGFFENSENTTVWIDGILTRVIRLVKLNKKKKYSMSSVKGSNIIIS